MTNHSRVPTTKRKRPSPGQKQPLPVEVEVYEIETLHHWPYESVKSVRIARASEPLILASNFGWETKYRCYDPGGTAYVSWVLVPHNFYRDSAVPNDETQELSAARLIRPAERWLQIDYVMFHSSSRSDDARLASAREHQASGELSFRGLPASLRPDTVAVGSFEDPHNAWYESNKKIEEPSTRLFISQRSKLPYINDHTIPEGADYEFVAALVCRYRPYRTTPTYAECLKNLRVYSGWFEQYLPEASKGAPASEAMTVLRSGYPPGRKPSGVEKRTVGAGRRLRSG